MKDDDDKNKNQNSQRKEGSVSFVTARSTPLPVPDYNIIDESQEKIEGSVNQVTSLISNSHISKNNIQEEAAALVTSNPFDVLASPPPSPPPASQAKEVGICSLAFTHSDRDLHLGNAAHANHVDHPPTHVHTPL